MVPILDVLLNLLLRPLQFVHDLLVPLLYGVAVVTLSHKIVLVVLPTLFFELVPGIVALFVDRPQASLLLFLTLLGL